MPRPHRSDLVLLSLVCGALVLGLLLWLVLRTPPPERTPVARLKADWLLEPRWEGGSSLPQPAQPTRADGKLSIYIDTSLPMLGFVPPPGSSKRSGLESLLRLAPDHLVRVNGGGASHLAWHAVAEGPTLLNSPPHLNAQFLDGKESRLDLALQEIRLGLERGSTRAAVLVTDLIATGELVGAQGAARALEDWVQSRRVLSGELDLGLLAVKAPYWGVRSGSCPATSGEAGCWLSEQTQRWLPMPGVRPVPLYALVFTRGRDQATRLLEGLGTELRSLGLEVAWELLTEATAAAKSTPTDCSVLAVEDPQNQQFALFATDQGGFRCERSETIRILCELPREIVTVEGVKSANPTVANVTSTKGQLAVELDCRKQRGEEFRVELKLIGSPAEEAEERWQSWSSVTDDELTSLGKTVRLQLFVEKARVRPSSFSVTAQLTSDGG